MHYFAQFMFMYDVYVMYVDIVNIEMCLILVSLVPIFVHVDGVAARPLARQQLILLMFPKPSHHTPYFYTEDTDMIQKRECTIFGWKTPDQISIQLLVKL